MSLIDTTDKVFWHDYISFYEKFFQNRDFREIAEIGILKGNSIRWLLERFPQATIYGADILDVQPEWPVADRFKFTQLDQGNTELLARFFSQTRFDLIIEDGSHDPVHQYLALMEGIKHLSPDGIYILEDIHTSHLNYEKKILKKQKKGNCLTVLLAIDHYIRINQRIDEAKIELIAEGSIFKPDDVSFLSSKIKSISLFKRTKLPDYCYRCNSSDYDYSKLKCRCGVDVFSDTDSMSFVITVK